MMTEVSKSIVDAAWKETARLRLQKAEAEVQSLAASQPDLVAFVTSSFEEMRPPAMELGLYLFFVLDRIFEKAASRPIEPMTAERVSSIYDRNDELLKKLDGVHQRFVDRAIKARQPHVMTYLVNALTEFGEAPGDVTLSDDEIATLFFVLKTATDVLDEASRSAGE